MAPESPSARLLARVCALLAPATVLLACATDEVTLNPDQGGSPNGAGTGGAEADQVAGARTNGVGGDEIAGASLSQGGGAGEGTGGTRLREAPPPGCEGTITFADPVVERVVRSALPDDVVDITHEDIWLFDTLDLEGYVSSLEGLECLTGLTFVKIQRAEISDLSPLSGLELLTFLALSYNQITELKPLRGLDTLQKLYVEGNPISDLGPLASLTELTHVSAGSSQVSDLSPLENLTNLEWVNMYNAEVTDLTPLVDNPGIGRDDEVNLNGNPIDCEQQAANVRELIDRGVNLVVPCPEQ